MSKKFLLVIEIVWLITGTLCVIASIRYIAHDGGKLAFVFPVMAIISFFFAWIRHRQRKKE